MKLDSSRYNRSRSLASVKLAPSFVILIYKVKEQTSLCRLEKTFLGIRFRKTLMKKPLIKRHGYIYLTFLSQHNVLGIYIQYTFYRFYQAVHTKTCVRHSIYNL